VRSIHKKVEDTQTDLSNFRTHVAENYAHNGRMDDMLRIVADTNKRVDEIYKILTTDKHR